jgi:hypothetical protein
MRYTSFAEDFEESDFSAGTVAFGQKVSCSVSRYGDLVSDLMLEVTLPPLGAATGLKTDANVSIDADLTAAYWVNAIGFAVIEEIGIEIGGTDVDTLYAEWMFMWEELTQRPGARLGEQIGKFDWSETVEDDMIEFAKKERRLFVPLNFWFNKYFMEKGLCIPLIALSFHDIKVKVTFRALSECCQTVYKVTDVTYGDYYAAHTSTPNNTSTGATLAAADLNARLLVNYVYLDGDERNAFASVEHEYIITTTQRQTQSITSAGSASDQIKLYFNHPSNALFWYIRPNDWQTNRRRFSVGHRDRFDFSLTSADTDYKWGDVTDATKGAALTLNGHDRFPSGLPGMFFRTVEPQMKWPNIPKGYYYMYTFAMQGGQWNPTSTLNFSRIDHVSLNLTYGASIPVSEVVIFAENYNLLVIKVSIWLITVVIDIVLRYLSKLHRILTICSLYFSLSLVATGWYGSTFFENL